MNIESGLNRLATVIVWLGTAAAVVLVLLGIGVFFLPNGATRNTVFVFVMLIVGAGLVYAAARLVAWIIRGFAES